jgi:hypothetical protein
VHPEDGQVFGAAGETVMGTQASCYEKSIEAVGVGVEIFTPVDFHPMSVIFIDEEADAGFDGSLSGFFG